MPEAVPSRPTNLDRRSFLRRAALVAGGVVAADQLEILDRLGWVRSLFPGWRATTSGRALLTLAEQPFVTSLAHWDALLRESYLHTDIVAAINTATPFKAKLGMGRTPKRLTEKPREYLWSMNEPSGGLIRV
jgi:hypothetical protein